MEEIIFDDKSLIILLKDHIPEVSDYIYPEIEFSAYLIFGAFGGFLQERVLKNSESSIVIRSFSFLNRLIENGDPKVIQLLRVTTLEMLTDKKETIDCAKQYLSEKGFRLFQEVINYCK